MATKYDYERRLHTQRVGQKPDITKAPKKEAVISDLKSELKKAQKKLEEMIANKNEKGIKKMREIVSNLEGTLARQH